MSHPGEPTANPGIPVEELVAYCTQQFLVEDLQVVQVYEELENLAYWLRGFAPHNVLEIGTTGVTFFLLSRLSTGKKVSIDLRDVRPKIHNFMFGHDWRFFQGNSQTTEMRDAVAAFCPRFDLVFIDGDHSYEGVARDFELYRELLSERGAVLFHDVDPLHVFKGGLAGEVYRLWEELDCGVKTTLCCNRSAGRISFRGERQHFGGFGIWKPA
ncbi:MAG TPA: class I SAM-dependent methyltransferase [Thermoanaerobaculia bacterium]|nr:class I SAM-dependent methyltransferase [Thermoanaerobaculia bacterium]